MPWYVTCPNCRERVARRHEDGGRQMRCSECGHRFLAAAVLDVPVGQVLEVLPVEEEDALPTVRPAVAAAAEVYSEEVVRLTKSHRLADRNFAQRLVFALLLRTLENYRSSWIHTVVTFGVAPLFLVLGVVLGFGLMAASGGVAVVASSVGSGWGNALVYVFPVLVLLIVRLIKSEAQQRPVTFSLQNEKRDGFLLGRLDNIFGISKPSEMGLYFGACFSLQCGLLFFSPDHAGLPTIEGSFGECVLLTLDNACHGIFLDFFELYQISFGPEVKHTILSATVFGAFRMAFDALVLLLVISAYQRFRMRQLFRDLPWDRREPNNLLEWLAARCGDDYKWPRRFFDEFIFLILVKEYLNGNFEVVRLMSQQFPWLAVTPEVRSLFRDEDGKAIFRASKG